MAKSWGFERRRQCLVNTVNFLKTDGRLVALLNGGKKEIVINGIEGIGSFFFRFIESDNKEGEITLSLHVSGIDAYIKRVIFSFERIEGSQVALVGCVQGNSIYYEKDKELQKSLYGLRPRALLIFVLQSVLPLIGVSFIYGVSNREHIFSTKHSLSRKLGKRVNVLVFNYDAFWQELGGRRLSSGWFELPLNVLSRDLVEIPSKKRSIYRKRYELMERIAREVRTLF